MMCIYDLEIQGQRRYILDIDFAKAFDSVTHERLLLKLEAIGITGALLQWF